MTGPLVLKDLTVQNGSVVSGIGGGVLVAGMLILTDTRLTSNTATARVGGGAYLLAAASVSGGSGERNRAPNTSNGNGGGLYALSTLNLTGTQFLTNTAGASGGWHANSALTLTQFIRTGDNIQNMGLTTRATGRVILFNGTGSQIITGTGSTTFKDMWVKSSGVGVWLGQRLTATNRLTLSSDLTTTSAYTLHLGVNTTGAGAGDVWGRTHR